MPTFNGLLSDAASVLELLGLASQVDIVGVYDARSFRQAFAYARPLKASIRETAKVMEHPAENGVLISDHRVVNPVEIEMPMLIPALYYGSMYQQIKSAFLGGTLLYVQTRVATYSNMFIADMPHEESPDIYDAITLTLRLRQVIYLPDPNRYAPADPQDDDTVNNGLQSPTTPAGSPSIAGAW
ncbi:phage baseplate protein [Singulisphaera sp. PoT]|uniref:phage baseplate protein n=1 Tax=Singulisphaera sp. PoT TaxID=3411797 RepID=UPI003BF571FC